MVVLGESNIFWGGEPNHDLYLNQAKSWCLRAAGCIVTVTAE